VIFVIYAIFCKVDIRNFGSTTVPRQQQLQATPLMSPLQFFFINPSLFLQKLAYYNNNEQRERRRRRTITVFLLEKHGRAETLQSAVGQNGDAISEKIGLVHEVSGQDHRPTLTFLLQYVPRLTASLRIHTGRRFVQDHKLYTSSDDDNK